MFRNRGHFNFSGHREQFWSSVQKLHLILMWVELTRRVTSEHDENIGSPFYGWKSLKRRKI